MTLSSDQRATLELLLSGDHDYADLGELFGLEVEEVRSRATTALEEIGGADPNANAPIGDYLLGQADPIDRADAVRRLKESRDEHVLAERISAGLLEIAPDAELPDLPPAPGASRFARGSAAGAPTSQTERKPIGSGLSRSQSRLVIVLGAGAVILIAIVLAVSGAFGGGDSSDSSVSDTIASTTDTTGTTTGGATTGTDATGQEFASVPLKPKNGASGSGTAVVGATTGDQAFVDLSLKGMKPAPKGQTYVVWMLLTPDQGYPLTPLQVDKNGSYNNRFPLDSAVLPIVARVQSINVSVAPVATIRKELTQAVQATKLVIKRPGKTVLQGDVPKSNKNSNSSGG